jgi:hypothetical protein
VAFVEVVDAKTLNIAVFAVLVSIRKLLLTPDKVKVFAPVPSFAVNSEKSRAVPAVTESDVEPEMVGEVVAALKNRTFEF